MQANKIRHERSTIDTNYLSFKCCEYEDQSSLLFCCYDAGLDRHPSKPSRAPILDNYLHGY